MIEAITLGQVAKVVLWIAGIIGGIGVIYKAVKKAVDKGMIAALKPINTKLDNLDEKIGDVDLNACKNFLVARLADIENGAPLGSLEEERFWEQYEHYVKKGGNSYIKRKVEQLKAEGRL